MVYDLIAVGNRAYEVRKNKKLTQNTVSAKLGIHQATYSKFELGQHDLHVAQLVKLCDILDVSVSWLVGENIIADLTDSERLLVENYIKYIKKSRNKSS